MAADRPPKEKSTGGTSWVPAISFKRPDGKDASGYLTNAGARQRPRAWVVIQEWWGLSEQIKGLCDRFALAGFDAAGGPISINGKVVPYHDMERRPPRK